jgi:hypothetical protein
MSFLIMAIPQYNELIVVGKTHSLRLKASLANKALACGYPRIQAIMLHYYPQ